MKFSQINNLGPKFCLSTLRLKSVQHDQRKAHFPLAFLIIAKASSGIAQISKSDILTQAAAFRNTRKASYEVAETLKNSKN